MLRASSGKRELFHRLCDDVLDRIGDKQLGRQDVVDALTAIADEYVWDEERTDVHAKSLIKEKGLWSHEYFGSLWQFRVVDGICYLPSGEKTQLNGINRELASCVICEELKNVIPDVQRTLKTRVGRLYPRETSRTPIPHTAKGRQDHPYRQKIRFRNRWERQFPHEHGDYRAGRRP